MILLGTILNAASIIICGLLGTFLIKNIPERFHQTLQKALALSLLYLGISGTLETKMPILLIMSLAIGGLVGELVDIDKGMNNLGNLAEAKLGFKKGKFSDAFVTASLLFCAGSMAIVGPLEEGLTGDHSVLFAKSLIDGVFSLMFSSNMGIGVVFSSVPVFIYQGAITLIAVLMKDQLAPEIICEMSAVGSLLIVGIALNLFEIKPIKVANLIPAIFIPWIYLGLIGPLLN